MVTTTAATAALGESMDETTLPAADFPDVIREGCALVMVRRGDESHSQRSMIATAATYTDDAGQAWCWTAWGPVRPEDLAIDLTRPSGQWAVACWLRGPRREVLDRIGYSPGGFMTFRLEALAGEAGPVELRRVALEVRGG